MLEVKGSLFQDNVKLMSSARSFTYRFLHKKVNMLWHSDSVSPFPRLEQLSLYLDHWNYPGCIESVSSPADHIMCSRPYQSGTRDSIATQESVKSLTSGSVSSMAGKL